MIAPGQQPLRIALKIDVDTDVGTRDGVPHLVDILSNRSLPGTFLFSLGPDNTGKAIRRVFRPGFLKKVSRTNVGKLYGWRTLMSGTILPPPHIGERHAGILRAVRDAGFEVGIHCYDHFEWQDYVHRFSLQRTREEFGKAVGEFERIFGEPPRGAGAPGWQANANSLQVYDEYNLLYGSDARGAGPFIPRANGRVFRTIQIPNNLPTLDELIGRPEYPEEKLPAHYLSLLRPDIVNILTIHAEIEGALKAPLFEQMLDAFQDRSVVFTDLAHVANEALAVRESLPVCDMADAPVDGRSGLLACRIG